MFSQKFLGLSWMEAKAPQAIEKGRAHRCFLKHNYLLSLVINVAVFWESLQSWYRRIEAQQPHPETDLEMAKMIMRDNVFCLITDESVKNIFGFWMKE